MLITGGANAAKSDGSDIRFSSDSAGSNGLHAEIVYWVQDATTDANRKAEIWVSCNPSSSADTTIYVWYKNPSATAPPANDATFGSQGVWDSNYAGVLHLANGTILTATDSTSHANNGTLDNLPTAVAGQIDGAANFANSGGYVNNNEAISNASLSPTVAAGGPITIEFWFYPQLSAATAQTIVQFSDGGSNVLVASFDGGGNLVFSWNGGYQMMVAAAPSLNAWHHIVYAAPGTGGYTRLLYIDGVSTGSGSGSPDPSFSVSTYVLGASVGSGYSYGYKGSMDEFRMSSSVRSADWVQTEYNNQKSPSTFWTVGSPVGTGGGLFLPSTLSGIGSGGPFFQNQLN